MKKIYFILQKNLISIILTGCLILIYSSCKMQKRGSATGNRTPYKTVEREYSQKTDSFRVGITHLHDYYVRVNDTNSVGKEVQRIINRLDTAINNFFIPPSWVEPGLENGNKRGTGKRNGRQPADESDQNTGLIIGRKGSPIAGSQLANNLLDISTKSAALDTENEELKKKVDVLYRIRQKLAPYKIQPDSTLLSLGSDPLFKSDLEAIGYATPKSNKEMIDVLNNLTNMYTMRVERIKQGQINQLKRLQFITEGFSTFGNLSGISHYAPFEFNLNQSKFRSISAVTEAFYPHYNSVNSDFNADHAFNLVPNAIVLGFADSELPDEAQVQTLPPEIIKLLPPVGDERWHQANYYLARERAKKFAAMLAFAIDKKIGESNFTTFKYDGFTSKPEAYENYNYEYTSDGKRRKIKFFVCVLAWEKDEKVASIK